MPSIDLPHSPTAVNLVDSRKSGPLREGERMESWSRLHRLLCTANLLQWASLHPILLAAQSTLRPAQSDNITSAYSYVAIPACLSELVDRVSQRWMKPKDIRLRPLSFPIRRLNWLGSRTDWWLVGLHAPPVSPCRPAQLSMDPFLVKELERQIRGPLLALDLRAVAVLGGFDREISGKYIAL